MKNEPTIKVINGRDIPRPDLRWEDLCLPLGMAEDIAMSTATFFQSQRYYQAFGLAFRRGFLFSGPPGCGKTLTAKVIVSTMRDTACVAFSPKGNFKEADQLESAFSLAEDLAPAILILEDLDKFGKSIPASLILNLLDGLDTPHGLLVIATTNEPGHLDPALLLRPSRFDRVWSFPLPDFTQRLAFLKKRVQGLFAEETLIKAAQLAQGFSMAYVQEIIASAVAFAVQEGRAPIDADILRGADLLRRQIKSSQEAIPRIGRGQEPVGFHASAMATSPPS